MKKIKHFLNWVKKHKILSVIGIIIICGLIFVFKPKPKLPIETVIAKKTDLIQSISVSGTIAAKNAVDLSFQTAGKLIFLGAKKGDTIYKGQAIVSLDKQDLEASFRQAQQDFTAAKAASEQYYSGHTNATESYDEKVKRTALDAAQNKAYDQMVKTQNALNNTTLYSPIDGILTRADAQNIGINITPATVFTITGSTSLVFDMDVDEADIGKVKEGQKVSVNLDAFPDENLNFVVNRIDFVSHTTSNGGNAFTVEVKLPNDTQNKYRVGMNGNADIITARKNNVITIPLSSIFDKDKIYIKLGKTYRKLTVVLGLQNDTDTEIISGLSQGQIVITQPSDIPIKK